MPRPRNPIPKYTLHKSSGQARVCIGGREVYLGVYNSPESRAAYARLVAELQVAPIPDVASARHPAAPPTIDEVLLAFWRHAEEHYRRADGTPTIELTEYRQAIKPVRELYGQTPAAGFGPLALKAVRQKMVAAELARTTINNRVRRLKHLFKWAAGEELVPTSVPRSLATVEGLRKGRTSAPEPIPVGPVDEARVVAVLPFLRPQVRGMVRLQMLTGMRPGEACRIRPCDVERSGPVWVYRPGQHKTAHRGKVRAVAIGPKAQALLGEFAPDDPDDYYFSPRRAVEGLHAERTAARKTPPYPSHVRRNRDKRAGVPARSPSACYSVMTYDRAVARACARAGVPRWSPNQIRHAVAAGLRAGYGLEHARAVLGHSFAAMSDHYSKSADAALAARVATEIG